jgi:hypothetical protein
MGSDELGAIGERGSDVLASRDALASGTPPVVV